MILFPIPEDVAYELSRIDLDFEEFERIDLAPYMGRTTHLQIAGKRQDRKCKICGCRDLEWTNTTVGWRLIYNPHWGKLSGRIHACQSEAE